MLSTLKNIATTVVAILQTRIELLGNELQVQKLLLAKQLGLALGLVFCIGLSVPLAIALAVAIWWDERVIVLGISTGLVILIAIWCYALLRRTLHTTEAVFAASLVALKDDMARLRASAGRATYAPDGSALND